MKNLKFFSLLAAVVSQSDNDFENLALEHDYATQVEAYLSAGNQIINIDPKAESTEQLNYVEKFLKEVTSRNGNSPTNCPPLTVGGTNPNCDFGDFETSNEFEEVFKDCYNQQFDANVHGRWYRPTQAFDGKPQSIFHIPPEDLDLREVTFQEAQNYCSNLHPDSLMWCPQSDIENYYIWWHHNGQYFGNTDGASVWTGIVRLQSSGIFGNDGYKCNNLFDQTYFNWLPNQPSFFDLDSFQPEWAAALTCNTPHWDDVPDTNPAAIVCEMMCDLYPDPTTTTASTTSTDETTTEDPCPQDNMTGTHSATISATDGLTDILNEIICDTTEIINHGCHCIKLGQFGFIVDYAGGSSTIDIVDSNCKKWRDAKRCITLPGGSCYGIALTNEDYVIDIDYDNMLFDCTSIADQCLRDLCLIDSEWAASIAAIESVASGNFSAIAGSIDECPKCTDCVPALSCAGQAPDVYLVK